MKLALIVHDLHTHGGHARYTRVLADAFAKRHDVTVFANQCDRPPDSHWQHTPVWALRQRAVLTVASFPLGMRRHASALKQFDRVHSQGFCGVMDGITTAHMCVATFGQAIVNPTLVNRSSFAMQEYLERRFYKDFRGEIIAVSERTARDLREQYGVRVPIHVVHHGVDTDRFSPHIRGVHRQSTRRRHQIRDDQTVALYVGDITKAHVGLKSLAARCPDVVFLIVTASIRYQWNARNVVFVPHTKRIEDYYAAADCFVFPTVNDPFGLVVTEAMATGLPVICSGEAGASELIQHGQNGYVFALQDWVEGAASLLSRPDAFNEVGMRAARTAALRPWANVAQETEQIYRLAQ